MKEIKKAIVHQLQQVIAQSAPFTVNKRYLQILETEAILLNVSKNEQLIRQDTVCKYMYFIGEGYLRSYFIKNGEDTTTWFGFSNEFLTVFDSFWLQIPSRESIEALTNCMVLAIPFETINKIFQIDQTWERMGRLLTMQYAIQLEDRVHLLHQATTAKEKYEYLLSKHPNIIQHIPNKYVASYLGLTRETLSRIRSSRY